MLVAFIKRFKGYLVILALSEFNSSHQVIGTDISDTIVAIHKFTCIIPVSKHGIRRTLIIRSRICIQKPIVRQ